MTTDITSTLALTVFMPVFLQVVQTLIPLSEFVGSISKLAALSDTFLMTGFSCSTGARGGIGVRGRMRPSVLLLTLTAA